MLIAALIVGGLTAFYFGLRAGAWAAGITAIACLVAIVVPAWSMPVYLLIGAGMIGVGVIGPRRGNPTQAVKATRVIKRGLMTAWSRFGGGGGGNGAKKR